MNSLKALVRVALNKLGWDLQRVRNTPRLTMLGIRQTNYATIVDVGANEGQFARKISEHFPSAKLVCLEPLPGPFAILHEYSKTSPERVKALNVAAGDREAKVSFNVHTEHSPSSSMLSTTKMAESMYDQLTEQALVEVQQLTLDQALATMEIDTPLLVKMDVQGYEDRVIAGAAQTLRRADACIVEVGVDQLYKEQARFHRIVEQMQEVGLAYSGNLEQVYATDGHCVYFDALFTREKFYSS